MLHFGSWVGGDMDGLPDVHAKTIRESCARHHALIVNRYYLEALRLAEKLSQSERRTPNIPQPLRDRIEHYKSVVPAARASAPSGHDEMPYRVLLGQIAERLRATYDHRSGQYERVDQLIDDLQIIVSSLEANRGRYAGLFLIRRFLRRVRTFGLHLATLDVRQNAEVHRQIVGRALDEEGWDTRPAAERIERLRDALARDESPPEVLEAAGKRALWVFEAMDYCRHRYGEAAVGSYVVSMARDIDDVLSVLLLARWAGLLDSASGQVALDVAPLFESVAALDAAGPTLARLLADPIYREHLAARGNRQVVMIGYADSNKESGITASRWVLRKAQQAMLVACEDAGVQLLVFHGRGGSISRGGSRTEAVVSSLPTAVRSGQLRVTEQGETINDRYGLQPIALRTFEQGLNTLALAVAGERRETIGPGWEEAMQLLSDASRTRYRAFVHDDPGFFEFFQAVTPVDVIERMQIGSRPLSRGGGSGVDTIRAVPWMFAWSQSRHMLPGWFGAGTGLAAVIERYGEELVGEMYRDWPFFAGADGRCRDAAGPRRHGHRLALRASLPGRRRALFQDDPAGVRPDAPPGPATEGLRAVARCRADAAALDLAAQSLRRSDPPDAGALAATLARRRLAAATRVATVTTRTGACSPRWWPRSMPSRTGCRAPAESRRNFPLLTVQGARNSVLTSGATVSVTDATHANHRQREIDSHGSEEEGASRGAAQGQQGEGHQGQAQSRSEGEGRQGQAQGRKEGEGRQRRSPSARSPRLAARQPAAASPP